MESLSLTNFENLLDPDLLEIGKEIWPKITAEEYEKGEWASNYSDENGEHEFALGIRQGERIEFVSCTCQPDDDLDLASSFCAHTVALTFFVQQKKNRKTRAVYQTPLDKPEKKPKIIPKAKPKDPAEQLLSELEAKEIYEFVRIAITKNADFRSYFLVHFSEKSGGNPQQYHDIVAAAIKSERGRKTYMKGGDVAKIVTKLAPIFKQAQQAETKGYFREAINILDALLSAIPPLFAVMETDSQKSQVFVLNCLDLLTAVCQSPNLTFELRDELFTMLLKIQKDLEEKGLGTWAEKLFVLTEALALKLSKIAELAATMRASVSTLREKRAEGRVYSWEIENNCAATLNRLLKICRTYPKIYPHYLAVLEENKYLKNTGDLLADELLSRKDYRSARITLEDLKNHYFKTYPSYTNTLSKYDKKILEVAVLEKNAEVIKAIGLRIFKISGYNDFATYDAMKAGLKRDDWSEFADELLKETEKGKQVFSTNKDNPHFEILARENRNKEMCDNLLEVTNIKLLVKYGHHLAKARPLQYVLHASKVILQQNYTYSFPMDDIVLLLTEIKQLRSGQEVTLNIINELINQRKVNQSQLFRFRSAGLIG